MNRNKKLLSFSNTIILSTYSIVKKVYIGLKITTLMCSIHKLKILLDGACSCLFKIGGRKLSGKFCKIGIRRESSQDYKTISAEKKCGDSASVRRGLLVSYHLSVASLVDGRKDSSSQQENECLR